MHCQSIGTCLGPTILVIVESSPMLTESASKVRSTTCNTCGKPHQPCSPAHAVPWSKKPLTMVNEIPETVTVALFFGRLQAGQVRDARRRNGQGSDLLILFMEARLFSSFSGHSFLSIERHCRRPISTHDSPTRVSVSTHSPRAPTIDILDRDSVSQYALTSDTTEAHARHFSLDLENQIL